MAAGRPTLSYQSKTTALSGGESLIGTGTECVIQIQGQGVATVHAAITVEGTRVLLEDRSPDQETRVNGQRASVVGIEAGNSLKFGEIELQVAREGTTMILQGTAGRFELATGENKVGRAPDCRVQIEDASISRYHATILVLPNKALVKDLKSMNRTMVNGRAVGVVELSPGDRIKLGEVEATFSMESAAEPVLFELAVDGGSRVLSPGELKIGRAPDCKISFSDDAGVSRYHAQITVGANTVRIRDLGSSNGTFVNSNKINAEVTLENGDRVEIGEHELVLRAKAPVDPLGKTVMASNLGGLVDKTVLMQKGPSVPPVAPGAAATGPWAVLELPQGASEDEIRRRYQERFSEYQVRLTNAPTPKLKEKYSQKLEELREAFAELVPDAAGVMATDLPSVKPVAAPRQPPSAAAPTPEVTPVVPQSEPKQAGPEPPPAGVERPLEAGPAEEKQRLPKSAFVMAGLGILALALAVTMTLLLLGAKKTEASLSRTLVEKQESIARMQQEIVDTEKSLEELQSGKATLLENKPFKVCNLSTQGDLRILWLAVAYVDEKSGQMTSFDSAFVGYPKWTVSPGGSSKFDFVSDDEVIWDGSALFFSMLFKHKGKEYHRSGSMQKVPDDCYKLALDGASR